MRTKYPKQAAPWGQGLGNRDGKAANGDRVCFWGCEDVGELAQGAEYLRVVHRAIVKVVPFMSCAFYLHF